MADSGNHIARPFGRRDTLACRLCNVILWTVGSRRYRLVVGALMREGLRSTLAQQEEANGA